LSWALAEVPEDKRLKAINIPPKNDLLLHMIM
jgi:hypothetical protein